MKRILCIVLCLMLAVPSVLAETADTLQKKFVRQLTAGYGIRGYASITASGVADWLNVLLPFTATDIQIRAIGEMQRDMSENITDDDDWQIKLYAENGAGQEVGTTWVYGDPDALYFKSDLLPGTVLTVPVEQAHLLYKIFQGDYADLFFAFDPFDMIGAGANGNVTAYEAVADILGISAEEWTSSWLPVLEKYLLHLDLWMASYGDPAFVTGESGALTMSATYSIPVKDLKAEAKYLIGQMLFDNDLQTLLLPHVTMEQRVTYLNPGMVYFYEACIDALLLEGEIILSREMSARGETVSTTVSLPLPPLPDALTTPVNNAAAAVLELPYTNLLEGMKSVTITQSGAEKKIILTGDQRSLALNSSETTIDDNTVMVNGSLRITPNAGVEENSLSAAFSCTYGHRIWQDENYLAHDSTTFAFSIEPDLSMLSDDDPFRNAYVDFAPIGLQLSVDFRNNPYQENSAVQINVDAQAKLPDAEIDLEMILRITTKLSFTNLSTAGAQDFTAMTEDKKAELLDSFIQNAVTTMSNLNAPAPTAVPEAAPTAVPPMNDE